MEREMKGLNKYETWSDKALKIQIGNIASYLVHYLIVFSQFF